MQGYSSENLFIFFLLEDFLQQISLFDPVSIFPALNF